MITWSLGEGGMGMGKGGGGGKSSDSKRLGVALSADFPLWVFVFVLLRPKIKFRWVMEDRCFLKAGRQVGLYLKVNPNLQRDHTTFIVP